MIAQGGVLITGGSGFLGRALVEKLLDAGCPRICIFSRNEFNQARMRSDFENDERLRWFIGDVRDQPRIERAMRSVEAVIHAAALKRIEVGVYNPEEMVKTNVIGSMNVIEAARRAGIDKALLVSSDKAFEPVSPYGQTKAIAESIFLEANEGYAGPKFAVVRYGNVAGSTGSVIPLWRRYIARGEEVKVTDPECTRFWMSREEAADLVLDTLGTMRGGEVEIPQLPAFRLGDLAVAMGSKHYEVTGLGCHEKRHESMAAGNCSAHAPRLTIDEISMRLLEVPA